MQYIKSLDGYRGLSVLLVFLYHAKLLPFGWVGVQMFFVLSGFLISSKLLEIKHYPLKQYLKIFYFKRILRIFPAYYGFILLVFAASLITQNWDLIFSDIMTLLSFTYNIKLSLTQNWDHSYSHLWSLSIEEQFYLIWPLIIFFVKRENLKKLILLIFFLGPLLRFFLAVFYQEELMNLFPPTRQRFNQDLFGRAMFLYMNLFSHIDAFSIGALLCFFSKKNFNYKLLLHSCLLITALSGVLFVLFGYGDPRFSNFDNFFHIHLRESKQYIWAYSLINLTSFALILTLIKDNSYRWFFEHPWLINLGKISFGFYLIHPLLNQVAKNFFPGLHTYHTVYITSWFILSYFIASLSYKYYESYFLRKKEKL